MRSKTLALHLLLFAMIISAAGASPQHEPPAASTATSGLSAEQQAVFDDARKSFVADDFAAALPKLRQLHEQVPENDVITKFMAEAAVNTGDFDLASSLLDSILKKDPDDPQALGIQAHLYGQCHDSAKLDDVIAHLQKLHDAGKPAPLTVMTEKDPLPQGGFVRVSDFIQPWSRFHIVLLAEFYDSTGQRIKRISLESDDIDQVSFARDHPQEAASGVRIYSMDSYSETKGPDGKVTNQVHATLCPVPGCFMTGRPTYGFFRNTVLGIKEPAPISTTTAPMKPSN